MGIGVNARTAFSLLFPPILDEFHWDRGVTAGAFSFGFVVSAFVSPTIGRMMDRLVLAWSPNWALFRWRLDFCWRRSRRSPGIFI